MGLIPLFLLAGCDFLDVVSEDDITTIDTDFETRDEAEKWLQSCYAFLMSPLADVRVNEALTGSDEVVYGAYLQNNEGEFAGTYIATGMQNSVTPYNDFWSQKQTAPSGQLVGRTDYYTAINLCNTFISKIDQVYNMESMEKAEWKAEVQAVKAYYYFELVRHYGPIILVPENIDPNVSIDEMKQPRSHVDSCFAAIVRLCDEAAAVLPLFNQKQTNRRTYFNKEAALALKARALLYQASPLFNGNPDYAAFTNKNGEPLFSTTVDNEKWRLAAEAAEKAIEVCLMDGKGLVDDQTAGTELQTHMRNIEASTETFNYDSDEILWMVKNSAQTESGCVWAWTLPNLNSDYNHLLSGTQLSPSMKMVEMFYTENGLPIDQDPRYGSGNLYTLTRETDPRYTDVVALNEDVLLLHTKREPRFYASIAADRCYWRLGTNVDNLYKVTAYQGEDFGLKATRLTATVPENISGYWIKKWSCSRATLTNYSSSVNALGDSPFPVFRVAELYLIAAEAWNEYLSAPDDRVYDNLNKIRVRAGIPTVQESWAMARDRGKVNTQSGMREIIQQEWNIEFAFEGYRFWNLRRWKTAPLELNESLYGWNVTGSNNRTFFNNGRGPIVVKSDLRFVAPRDYFWPIRSEEVLISGCKQNPGW